MRILLTQGRSAIALEIARHLHRAGHLVVVCDTLQWTVCRYSRAVFRSYVVPSPRTHTTAFLRHVRRIVAAECIERIIPIFEEVLYLAADTRLQPLLFASSFGRLHQLHNKYAFAEAATAAGLCVADTSLLTCEEDVRALDRRQTYAIKPCYARAAQALVKFTPEMAPSVLCLTPDTYLVAQRWIEGRRYCSYSVCEAGQVQAHVVYPVDYTVDGHSCVYFTACQHRNIDAWVKRLVQALELRGQIAIDFIEDEAGRLFAIECNPRATSGAHLFDANTELAVSLSGVATTNGSPQTAPRAVQPSKQVALGMLLYAWRQPGRANKSLWAYLYSLATTRDVVFAWHDALPALMQMLALYSLWRQSCRLSLTLPDAFLFDFAWDVAASKKATTAPACTG